MGENKDYKVIVDLLLKAKEKEGLDVVRLRNEIRKEIEAGNKTLGQCLKLLETFKEIIPSEKQRYHAVLKALSATSGLSRQDIIESTDSQIREMKKIENEVLSVMKGYSDELKDMDSRLSKIKNELAKLRERMEELEKEEKDILGIMGAKVRMREGVEQTVSKVLTEIGAEITDIRNKVEKFSSEEASARTITPPAPFESGKRDDIQEDIIEDVKGDFKEDIEQEMEIDEILEPQYSGSARKCPLCGDGMNFQSNTSMWVCYTCGNQELQKDDALGEGIEQTDRTPEPPETGSAKKCPMCEGRMNFYINTSTWMCYSCGHEQSEKDDTIGTSELKTDTALTAAPEPPPPAEPASVHEPAPDIEFSSTPDSVSAIESKSVPGRTPIAEDTPAPKQKQPAAAPSSKQRPQKKKSCPVCRKQMKLHEEEKIWRCPFCDYQRREF